ncbi:MAG: pyridoxal phosphate-dependent aminotransferase [Planctomycetota bacterium]
MPRNLATRMSRLGTETAFEVLARAKALEAQGKSIVHLEIGQPDFPTPKHIVDACKKALDEGKHGYTPSPGINELRDAVAEFMNRTRNLGATRNNVVITSGAKPVMWFLMLALLEPGDEAIYPNPGFPIYESVINFLGATPVPIPLLEEKDFRFDIDELERLITPKTKLLIINTPQNPTGGILTKDDLARVAEIARKHDFWILSDEIYDQIIYDDFEFTSITQFEGMKERTVILNGCSKSYAMTGWRIGFGVMPESLTPSISRLVTNSDSCAANFSQWASVQALLGDHAPTREMVKHFKERRDVIVDGLNAIPGITCRRPLGAFYVFANVKALGKDSKWIADYFLNECGVACLDGKCFGKYGDGYVRFSYANSVENIQEALKRIAAGVAKIGG